jgi:NADPH:quinone reductase-like Zn-dependent oxidoreductase
MPQALTCMTYGMKAIGVNNYGETLHEVDVPAEPLVPGKVRVRVRAAAVNPTDTNVRTGARATADKPVGVADVPGMDAAGVVTEIAENTETPLAVGDRVMAIVRPSGEHGAYREEVVLPAGSVVRAPANASDAEAATLPMNGLTARQALDLLALEPGQVLALTGAAGAFGGYVIQLAKVAGLTVIADASAADEQLVKDLGADIVVRRGDDVATRIREHFPDGVDGLADGALLNELALPAVRDGGAVATVRGYQGNGERGLRVSPVTVARYVEERDKLDELRELAEAGRLTPRVAEVLPAAAAAQAHEKLAAGGVRGRLVLQFD